MVSSTLRISSRIISLFSAVKESFEMLQRATAQPSMRPGVFQLTMLAVFSGYGLVCCFSAGDGPEEGGVLEVKGKDGRLWRR